jgi:hypothetical protein
MREKPFTGEMKHLFDAIVVALNTPKATFFFLQGPGGCGKSTFLKTLMAYVRSKGFIALGCASTGLAATVYDDFSTAHKLFGIPVQDDDDDADQEMDLQTNMSDGRRLLLNEARLLAWDESLGNHKQAFMMVYNELVKKADNPNIPKVFFLMGDNKQIAPVVKYGRKQQIINASLVSSELFQQLFTIHKFTTNMRMLERGDYEKMLLEVGMGIPSIHTKKITEDEELESQIIEIPILRTTTDKSEVTQFLYPFGFDKADMYTKCILASKYTHYLPIHANLINFIFSNKPSSR